MSAEFVVTFLPLEILGYSQQCFQVLLSIMWSKQQRHAIDDGYASPYYVLAKLISRASKTKQGVVRHIPKFLILLQVMHVKISHGSLLYIFY